MDLPFITGDWIDRSVEYPELVDALEKAFSEYDIHVPMRHHHDLGNNHKGTMLLMPAWKVDKHIGVKLVNVFPENTNSNLASIQGIYIHFDGKTGVPLCLIDAKSLTNKRTAAASALASKYLSREDSKTLLMLGTGSLAPEMIKAHAAIRPIEKVFVWGREIKKAETICLNLGNEKFECIPVSNKEQHMGKVDIISSATMSKDPLVFGRLVSPGTHIDLVGSYKPDMREADDDLMVKSKIYVDTIEGATIESGDLAIPIAKGVIDTSDIISDLHSLCREVSDGHHPFGQITLFKSVGYALEDLACGQHLYEKYNNETL